MRSVSVQIQFVSKSGRIIRFYPYDGRGQRIATAELPMLTCGDVIDRTPPKPKPVKRPTSDTAGISRCIALAREYSNLANLPFGSELRARLVISTPKEWGAVLSDGHRRIACSLYPAKEIGPIIDAARQ